MNQNDIQSMQRTNDNLNQKLTLAKGQAATDPVQVAINELQLKVTSAEDKDEIKKILQILQYPSTQIAELHLVANRLGNRDEQQQGSSIKTRQQLTKSAIYCPCCSMVKQQYELKLCHKLDDISNIGIIFSYQFIGLSTFLYFQTIKNLAIILVQMLLIYSVFAFASNVVASGKFKQCGTLYKCGANLDYLAISLGSKQLNPTTENQTFYYIQCWLGVAMVVIWFITFAILKYREKLKQLQVDNQTRSASDFALVIEGLPDSMTEAQFAVQLKNYQEKIQKMSSVLAYKKKQINIKKFNKGKPFHISQSELKDQQLEKLQQESKQMKELLAGWILERQDSHSFSQTKEQMVQFYKKFQVNIEAQKKRITEVSQKLKEKMNADSFELNPVYFVTLDSSIAKSTIVELNPREYSSRLRNFITCSSGANNFDVVHKGSSISVKIQRAPQPEDIIWANIGLTDTQRICRKIMTFSVTVIILGLSFLAVYGLSVAQRNNVNNRFLSILISLVISLINIIITQSIRYLSIYQRDYTTIKYQTSLAIKSILASLVNSILIPIIANRFIKNNIYDKNGLADDIFMLGLTNAFVTPILKYFDGYYYFTKLMQWIKTKPASKLYLNQMELNQYMTGLDFEIGYQYVYVVHLYLFVCFFVSLQPIVCAFALVGYFIMFWTQKWALFNRMRRPIPGNDLINTALGQLIFLGPIVYSLGSLTWSNFFPQGTPKYAIVPNLISLGISALMFIFPLSIIFSACLGDKQQAEIKYDESRIFFPTQYDRLNPSTAQEGLKDYMTYVQGFGKNMKGQSQQQQQKFADMMRKNVQRGTRPVGPQAMPFAPNNMMNFFAPPQQPTFAVQNQFFPGMMPPQMQMRPMMGFQQSPMFMAPSFQSFSSFNPVSSFMPQQPAFIQPQIPAFQPVVQQPKPFVQPQQNFIPPQQNVIGFGQPQNQFNPVGFQGQNQGFNQPPPQFGQPQGFNQPPPGFGQPQGFNQPPGFGQPQGFNPFFQS